jgi:general nucleoside transport system ATP-binding protein
MVAALRLVGVRKSFGGFVALDGAEFEAEAGEVHALLGENGAGKSSLMNVAAGLYAPEAGQIFVNGEEVVLSGPRDATASRIGMVHQEFKLVRPFTVVENVLLANWSGRFAPGAREIERQIRTQAAAIGFDINPKSRIDELSIAERQRVEIIKVLLAGARILILDEPTAVLTDEEAVRLLTTVRALAAGGAAVILVTHKLGEVTSFTDRVTVMRGGRAVAHLDSRATDAAELTRLAVGTAVASPRRVSSSPSGAPRITIKDLQAARADGHLTVNAASFHVCAGEIYGIAGVGGNGQTELVEALTGVRRPLGGTIEIEGVGNATGASPERLRNLGIACIPADRFGYGVAGGLSVVDNFCVGHIGKGAYGSWVHTNGSAMREATTDAVGEFDVQGVRTLRQRAAQLSGGNAQKLIIAREFTRNPKVIIAHSPSRGLDVRACAAVQERLLNARADGAAILLISDDLDEVLNLSDRIGVMTRGRIAAEFAAPADRQAVGRIMVQHA